jgi:hypothetical protein
MQRACAIYSPVACPVLQYFSTLFHKRYDFRKKKYIESKIYILNVAPYMLPHSLYNPTHALFTL